MNKILITIFIVLLCSTTCFAETLTSDHIQATQLDNGDWIATIDGVGYNYNWGYLYNESALKVTSEGICYWVYGAGDIINCNVK